MVTFILAYVYIVHGFINNVDVGCRYEMMVAGYYIIIVVLWSYAYMIIQMHIYAFHI